MKIYYYTALLISLLISYNVNSQHSVIVSKFSWNDISLDPTIADVGPNALSISSSAKVDVNGYGGTTGLNAGLPKMDIIMIFTDNPIFNLDGIELSVAYQRDESVGTFMKRGSYFSFLDASFLTVKFRLKDETNTPNYIDVNAGNVYPIPSDGVFRVYRFRYNQFTGVGTLDVDGDIKWTYNGTPGQVMDWSNGGNMTIGTTMDGSGSNRTFYDEYILSEVLSAYLPIELISFSAQADEYKSVVNLNWVTASETNNDFFTIERSSNGLNWETLSNIDGAGNSSSKSIYSYLDKNPFYGVSYYRLKQTDFDGLFEYFPVKSVECNFTLNFEMSPNPIRQGEVIHFKELNTQNQNAELLIYASNGVLIKSIKISKFESNIQLKNNLKPGIYFVIFEGARKKLIVSS
ncbi:T9SS type A sorting domain-containing protein [Brumimicrobium glaciale]|uniref:T9SS type A sorting domain-containing protein n=1 Tax=Brumimicrobium glaciale TaxID=200475 RepID=A0A4Q4KL67_9FLAO|nr:T9SS type A sorting domain-containing protein [Brumimicrobium glaciale]RYM33477.1 T9SS type A sorting domain-containing protein [Brumimicrobium glaciale]